MQEPTWEAMLKRLDYLEQEQAKWKQANYCWKLFGVAAVSMLGLIVLLGAAIAKDAGVVEEVRAKRFVVVDEEGQARVVLGRTIICSWRREKGDAMGLALFDGNNGLRAALGVSADGQSGLFLCDKNEMRRISLDVGTIPALYLAGEDGIDRAWLEVGSNRPALVFRDERTNQRLVLGAFTLWSSIRSGQQHIDLNGTGESRPPSSLVLIDGDGRIIWKAP